MIKWLNFLQVHHGAYKDKLLLCMGKRSVDPPNILQADTLSVVLDARYNDKVLVEGLNLINVEHLDTMLAQLFG